MASLPSPTSIVFTTPDPEPVIEGEEVHPCTHSWDTNAMRTTTHQLGFRRYAIVTSIPCSWCGAIHVAYAYAKGE